MSEDEFTWEDPPPSRGSLVSPWKAPLIARLRLQPGRWAKVKTTHAAGGLASHGAVLRKAGCEAAQRKLPDGTIALYARWPETTP